jgi:hypothetical protein
MVPHEISSLRGGNDIVEGSMCLNLSEAVPGDALGVQLEVAPQWAMPLLA